MFLFDIDCQDPSTPAGERILNAEPLSYPSHSTGAPKKTKPPQARSHYYKRTDRSICATQSLGGANRRIRTTTHNSLSTGEFSPLQVQQDNKQTKRQRPVKEQLAEKILQKIRKGCSKLHDTSNKETAHPRFMTPVSHYDLISQFQDRQGRGEDSYTSLQKLIHGLNEQWKILETSAAVSAWVMWICAASLDRVLFLMNYENGPSLRPVPAWKSGASIAHELVNRLIPTYGPLAMGVYYGLSGRNRRALDKIATDQILGVNFKMTSTAESKHRFKIIDEVACQFSSELTYEMVDENSRIPNVASWISELLGVE